MPTELPPCGLYRTTADVGSIPAGRLVYFHNHGEPGPGLYLPRSWNHNRAEFEPKGHTVEPGSVAGRIESLPAEGFYRVVDAFHCCDKKCMRFETDALLQLGYNANAEPILFSPELVNAMLAVPAQGQRTSLHMLEKLSRLHVPTSDGPHGASH